MTRVSHTDEFSIVLHLDNKSSRDIAKIRNLLPNSPYRDDKPHITLLQGIVAPRHISDDELLSILSSLLKSILKIHPHAYVHDISNTPGGHYTTTSIVELTSSTELQQEHVKLIKALGSADFRLGRASHTYSPHITIRLGVLLSGDALDTAAQLFPKGREVEVDRWAILRLADRRHTRPSYELDP
ncbi:MAG: 2'-5' RNA ligase family protein [Candidatus Saccharimonadales bacterium]|jgi:2'-5' RNA ligase